VRLTGVFDYQQVVFSRDGQKRVHVSDLPVDVDGHDRLDRLSRSPTERASCDSIAATAPEVLGERLRAHTVRVRIDVHELGIRTGLADRLHRRNECVGNGDHRVIAADTGRHQRKAYGVGTICHPYTVFGTAVVGELPFKRLNLCTANESSGP
jgi:hypothetical protein